MRKMLIVLTLAVTAVAASSVTSAAAAAKCPRGTYLVVCSSTVSVCCPNGAECLCPPPEA